MAATLFAGGMAGVMNWAGCLPIDTLKSRYQVRLFVVVWLTVLVLSGFVVSWMETDPCFQVAPEGKYKHGIRSVFAEIMKNEGPKALYRGAAPVFIRAFPANACCFIGIEATLKLFKAIDF